MGRRSHQSTGYPYASAVLQRGSVVSKNRHPGTPRVAFALAVCLLALLGASAVLASGIQLTDRCKMEDPGGVKLRAARETVAQECDCSQAKTHRAYLVCVDAAAMRVVARGELPQSCRAAVNVCASKTTCGRSGGTWVACCLDAGSGRQCRMASSPAACVKMRGTPNTHAPACASCCDACPNPGDGPSCDVP